ncbi:cubilin-like isoform X2 [Daphnia pulex]|nr:cubilin-like isoform X2 [Daphnia pulex]
MFGALLYFPVRLANIKMEIVNLIASKLTTSASVAPVGTHPIMAESIEIAAAEIQADEEIMISGIIPPAIMLRPLTVCSTNGCGTCENQTSQGGIISSPDYPEDYGNDRACVYTIRVSNDQKIQLSFTVFHVEFHYDWIDIYDGITPSQISPNITLGFSLTGYDLLPIDRNSTLNVMTIHFVSDHDNSELPMGEIARWQAKYTAI